jgi:dissimilatory sulfite reductase (desulfoviridin) alpha/beta subunit
MVDIERINDEYRDYVKGLIKRTGYNVSGRLLDMSPAYLHRVVNQPGYYVSVKQLKRIADKLGSI